jgi:hypothetical protein
MQRGLTNEQLDTLLVKELPGYRSVFLTSPLELTTTAFLDWRKEGRYSGWPRLEWHGSLDYQFRQYPDDDFYFIRSTNEKLDRMRCRQMAVQFLAPRGLFLVCPLGIICLPTLSTIGILSLTINT